LERKEQELYNQRRTIGQIADQKKKFAREQPYYPDAPKEPVSASELIRQQQDILARNGENRRKRDKALSLHAERNRLAEKVNFLKEELEKYQKLLIQTDADMTTAYKTAEQLQDESTAELEKSITDIENINRRVQANLDKAKAESDALDYENKFNALTADIENPIRTGFVFYRRGILINVRVLIYF
jgi:chromosome segregation ATPase